MYKHIKCILPFPTCPLLYTIYLNTNTIFCFELFGTIELFISFDYIFNDNSCLDELIKSIQVPSASFTLQFSFIRLIQCVWLLLNIEVQSIDSDVLNYANNFVTPHSWLCSSIIDTLEYLLLNAERMYMMFACGLQLVVKCKSITNLTKDHFLSMA